MGTLILRGFTVKTFKHSVTLVFLVLFSTANLSFANNLLKNSRFQEVENGLPKVGAASKWGGEAKFEISKDGLFKHNDTSLMISSETGGNASWGLIRDWLS